MSKSCEAGLDPDPGLILYAAVRDGGHPEGISYWWQAKLSLRIFVTLFVAVAAGAGCARHAPMTYRYVRQDSKAILIPPGVADANASVRTFRFRTAVVRRPDCAVSDGGITIKPGRRELRIAVNRELLVQHTPGWLSKWAVSYEERGCLARGDATQFATQIAEALPLEP